METAYWAGRTVVVTGGTGFIGSQFTEGLLARGAEVVCLYRRDNRGVLAQLPGGPALRAVRLDLLDETGLEAVLAQEPGGVDAIVHCAALTGGARFRREHPAQILDANVRAVSNVLAGARRHDVQDVVLLGSSEIYLSPTDRPTLEEDDFRAGMPYALDGYYLSKNYAEILAEAYAHEYGMNIFRPRLTSIYGPRDNFEKDTDRVVPAMFARAAAGRPIEIWGDGSQTRTYMYVTDLVDATLRMVEKKKHPVLNMGTAETVTLLELAREVCAALGRPERVTFDPTKSGGRRSRTLDLGKLSEIIDFEPCGLREGLRRTVEWYHRFAVPTG
ncbi:NAD-dependent epimerase/dehydratase family protein [Streptomyces sp. NPDC058335]|uniref:NAD-dependent epimerase/dehydratase family protein n=1 Tax=Streptomyces sp. NPDC058335 TaxID=3346451 RepID=UPI00364D33AA